MSQVGDNRGGTRVAAVHVDARVVETPGRREGVKQGKVEENG